MQVRVVRPEILDTLHPDDPGAVANRRDLRFLNRFMGNWAWVGRRLRQIPGGPEPIVEAGAGEGDLGFHLRRKGILGDEVEYAGLDLWGRPSGWPESWGWLQADLLDYQPERATCTFVANLLLHQFEDEALIQLGEVLRTVPNWVICEPLRVPWSIWGLALLRPFGLHPVSWHDGRVSVRAGFRRRELPDLLGADQPGRKFRVQEDARGAYRLFSWLET